ncbi:MAG: hypothetical protein ACRDRP_05050 [Pseudonocardiaceae bacterium]
MLIEPFPFRILVVAQGRRVTVDGCADRGRRLLTSRQAVHNAEGPERVVGGSGIPGRHPPDAAKRLKVQMENT